MASAAIFYLIRSDPEESSAQRAGDAIVNCQGSGRRNQPFRLARPDEIRMNVGLQPLDFVSLIRAFAWPAVAAVALVAFHKALGELITILGQRFDNISVAGISLELTMA